MSHNNQNSSRDRPQLPGPRELFPHVFYGGSAQQQPHRGAASIPTPHSTLAPRQGPQKGNHLPVTTASAAQVHPALSMPPHNTGLPNSQSHDQNSRSVTAPSLNGTLHPAVWTDSNTAPSAPPNDRKRYACEECGKRFERPSSLETHMHSHTGERPFKCMVPGCDRYFSTRSNMQRHVRTNHQS